MEADFKITLVGRRVALTSRNIANA
jgi:hypothetical protein